MSEPNPVGDYCDYLDKEMTIMGLLTAFSVVVPAVVLDRLAGAKEQEQTALFDMWNMEQTVLGVASICFFLAALAFYLQRSQLAYFYGQLRLSCTEARYPGVTTKDILREADAWSAWIRYQTAWALLIAGFVLFGIALFAKSLSYTHPLPVITSVAIPCLGYILLNCKVKLPDPDTDHPWIDLFKLNNLVARMSRKRP
jgi:uncharacterized membrane protein YidH (DUF202 family)